uniref:Uncharacterized protein n=1 Tax=Brassica oleracea TaxID=3712 RepID=A0A3P6FDT1_BRAOL|nr:unnamed protein product [Brassica oleracea]
MKTPESVIMVTITTQTIWSSILYVIFACSLTWMFNQPGIIRLIIYVNLQLHKVVWFECTATIDDVVHGSHGYYIAYGGCKTKATKGPTTLYV